MTASKSGKTLVPITKDGEPVLRKQAKEVPVDTIQTEAIQNIVYDMSFALSKEKYGVAIAAPQIGASVRIFVVAGSVLGDGQEDKAFINPVILRTSKKLQSSTESCLSIQGRTTGPDVAGMVHRPLKITIAYYDSQGIKSERGASGFLAAIFDHEIDHLNGTLFIDKASEEWEIDADFNRVT